MKRLTAGCLLASAMAIVPAEVTAQVAYTAKDVHLRAGPARDYPVVAILSAGLQITVQGCLPNYTWCDVYDGTNRGWVYAANINYPYQGATVTVLGNGTLLGIAIFGFILGDYWSSYYRDRPWYPEREQWIHRPVPAPRILRRPPPPPPYPVRPGLAPGSPPPPIVPVVPRPRPPQGAPANGQRHPLPPGAVHPHQHEPHPPGAANPIIPLPKQRTGPPERPHPQ